MNQQSKVDAMGRAEPGALPTEGLPDAAASRTATLQPHPVDLSEMVEKFALQQLAWTYCHAIDRGDLRLLRSLYHDDAIDDHGPMFRGSPDEYVAWLPGMLANWESTSHVISNMLFLVEGHQAEGELAVLAYHRTPGPDLREVIARGRYLDRYEKRDGIWRFYRRSLVLDSMEERIAPAGCSPSLDEGIETGRADAGDACFTRLAMFARQRGLPDEYRR
ncbi:nuclear transport factor 2 family protein [Pseudomonas sp. SCB32]|uniref:nuclear transport factor 2 family protein n=1 Tax=Pseudomonas sp. SCB32 TaxID=2653853 RepID=UPI0012648292|nr:nuclear transport factor 2 family protein [Pseudomonas sp. SCB32]